MKSFIPYALATSMLLGFATVPVRAGDIQGDAYDCQDLWSMRNHIFKTGGYCFKYPRAIKAFGNAGCSFDTQADVPLSDNDRLILRDIRKSEARQHC